MNRIYKNPCSPVAYILVVGYPKLDKRTYNMSSDGKYFGGEKREERVIGSLRLGGSNLKIGGQRRSH